MSVSEGTLLGGRVKYRQFESGHRSGFEPVLLAAAVPAQAGERVLEAGTGAGAGLLCLAARVAGITGIGLEIDPALTALAAANFAANGFAALSAVCGDVSDTGAGPFDHAFANPPWHQAADTKSPNPARALAHHAPAGGLPTWIAALAKTLKPRGSLTLILPAARLSEAAGALRQQRFGGIELLPLWPRAGRPAGQFIVSGRLGARTADQILPGLTLHGEHGLTDAAEAVLRGGGALRSSSVSPPGHPAEFASGTRFK